jgi:hypothetical protein
LKTFVHTQIAHTFIAALVIIAQTWKQPKCPSLDEWINNLWYVQIMEYYSALKRNELLSEKRLGGNLKCMSLSEKCQSEKVTYCMIPSI